MRISDWSSDVCSSDLFERASLTAARRVAPHWPRGLLADCFPADWREALVDRGCASLHLDWQRTRGADVAVAKEAGYAVAAYTVNGVRTGRRMLDKADRKRVVSGPRVCVSVNYGDRWR